MPSPSPNYWCTWSTQSAHLPAARRVLAPLFGGDLNRPTTRDSLCEEVLFGPEGWTGFYPESRADLYFLLDDGWDVPYGAHPHIPPGLAQFGAMAPDPRRFPSLSGAPGERLAELTRRVTDAGWRGLGLWVAIQSQGAAGVEPWRGLSPREEWTRKISWCAEGGVSYLKVDWGASCGDIAFRQMLTEIRDEVAPGIVIEHCRCQPPVNGLNDDGTGGGRRLMGPEDAKLRDWERQVLPFSDVWRIYDWIEPLSVPQGIDRTVTDIRLVEETSSRALVSTEDGLYLGAALGCAFGVMRSPLRPPTYASTPCLHRMRRLASSALSGHSRSAPRKTSAASSPRTSPTAPSTTSAPPQPSRTAASSSQATSSPASARRPTTTTHFQPHSSGLNKPPTSPQP